jgi:hypothetical protein
MTIRIKTSIACSDRKWAQEWGWIHIQVHRAGRADSWYALLYTASIPFDNHYSQQHQSGMGSAPMAQNFQQIQVLCSVMHFELMLSGNDVYCKLYNENVMLKCQLEVQKYIFAKYDHIYAT